MKFSQVLFGALVPGAIAVPASLYKVHERRDTVNSKWIKTQSAESATKVPVRIALKQNNVEKGDGYLMEV